MKKTFLIFCIILCSTSIFASITYGENNSYYYRYHNKDTPPKLFDDSTIQLYLVDSLRKTPNITIPVEGREYTSTYFECYQIDDPNFITRMDVDKFRLFKSVYPKFNLINDLTIKEQLLLRIFRFTDVVYDKFDNTISFSNGDPQIDDLAKYFDSFMFPVVESPISYHGIFNIDTNEFIFFIKFLYFGKQWIFFNKATILIGDLRKSFINLSTTMDSYEDFVYETAFYPITEDMLTLLSAISNRSFNDDFDLRFQGDKFSMFYNKENLHNANPIHILNLLNFLKSNSSYFHFFD